VRDAGERRTSIEDRRYTQRYVGACRPQQHTLTSVISFAVLRRYPAIASMIFRYSAWGGMICRKTCALEASLGGPLHQHRSMEAPLRLRSTPFGINEHAASRQAGSRLDALNVSCRPVVPAYWCSCVHGMAQAPTLIFSSIASDCLIRSSLALGFTSNPTSPVEVL
jgi:hypothetical protein